MTTHARIGRWAGRYVAPGGPDPHIGVPTRMYFALTGTPAATPAFNAGWGVTASAAQRPLLLLSELATGSTGNDSSLTETSTSVVNRLKRQHISSSTIPSARTITGTLKAVIRGFESSASADAYLQLIAYVVSGDGSAVRGVLYAGQTASTVVATADAPNQEFPITTPTSRILPAVTMTDVLAQAGDRIVVEIGYRACNTSASSMGVTFNLDDRPDTNSGVDSAFISGLTSAGRPWVEFNYDIFGA